MKLKLLILISLSQIRAYAVPTLYPETFNRQLRNNTTSNVVADNRDAARFWVLPPTKSAAVIQNLHTVTANTGFCQEIANLQRYNADTITLLNSLKDKRREVEKRLEQEGKNLKAANEKYLTFIKGYPVFELEGLFTQVRETKKRATFLYDNLKKCVRDCAGISAEIERTEVRLGELYLKKRLKAENHIYGKQFTEVADRLEKAEETVAVHEEDLYSMQEDLRELYADFNRMFDAHAQREGGRVSIRYDSHWSESVSRLSADNPGLRFERMPTKNALLRAGAYSRNSLLPNGSVLSFDVGGMSAGPLLTLEAFPENFGGNAVLNLLAVCPLLHPDWFDIPAGNDVSQMSYPLTVSYEYPTSMNYEITVTYNMYRMYELIKTQGTSGGFFNSSSWSHQDEQSFFKDAFQVDWKIQDDRKVFTEQQKLEINRDLLRQVMSRLASNLVMNDSGTKIAAPGEPPQNGALVLSNSLNKSCPINIYCQGASIVFNVMNSIFGSSSAMQNLKRITNVTMTDTYRSEQVVLQPMLSSFQ